MKEDVKEFRKTKDYLICIDSDGCVMDTMDVKHMRCFGPCLVYEWDLGEYRDEIIRLWRKVNLLSASRGVNRFQGLAQVLKNIRVTDKAKAQADADVRAMVDQVAKELGSDGRILVRESGTEPVVRVMVEAPEKEICEKYVDQVIDKIVEKGYREE